MGMYMEIVKAKSKTADDKVMWLSIAKVDELLEKMRAAHPEVYAAFINDTINLYYDKHFDEMLAEMVVDKMYHCEKSGSDKRKVHGEHYSVDYARKVRADNRELPYNEWDWYVLLNMMYHDNECMLDSWYPEEDDHDRRIVAMAVNYLTDDDASETKLWDRFMK